MIDAAFAKIKLVVRPTQRVQRFQVARLVSRTHRPMRTLRGTSVYWIQRRALPAELVPATDIGGSRAGRTFSARVCGVSEADQAARQLTRATMSRSACGWTGFETKVAKPARSAFSCSRSPSPVNAMAVKRRPDASAGARASRIRA